ncbi:hypothetical protein FJT64_017053 [Amphibalanus amphitrite]|uniref:Uncharacterized protein n=1 Tax=Amphibalanus amphitrite TaxID=1232801 RepID=A0A6A4WX73_AMPAM|nr:hypothetical protein FJT64_017053 [Amphibalanus amphitrite]
MHLYGQRRVCIGAGYLGAPGRPCRVLSVQRGRFNGDPGALTRQLAEFGCAAGGHRTLYTERAAAARRFSLRRQLQQLGGSRLDLLDVSVPGRDADVLWDLLRPGAKVSADQVALTVVLDENAVLGEEAARSSFSPAVARGYLKMLTRLEALGYRLLSFKPHPSCVESVRRELDICLPILSNTVWIK